MTKLEYIAPELKAHGKVEEITEGFVNRGTQMDRFFPARRALRGIEFS